MRPDAKCEECLHIEVATIYKYRPMVEVNHIVGDISTTDIG